MPLAIDPFVPLQAVAHSRPLDRLISSRLSDPVLLLIRVAVLTPGAGPVSPLAGLIGVDKIIRKDWT